MTDPQSKTPHSDALWRRMVETREIALSEDDVAALEAESAKSLTARKMLGMHYFKAGAYGKAAEHTQVVFEAEPNAETARNLMSARERAGDLDGAIAFAEAHAEVFDPIERADRLCSIYVRQGKMDEGVTEGTRALELKDALTGAVDRPDPIIRRFDPSKPGRNIITFSLFGDDPRYLRGAHHNAVVTRYLYPGWTPRFYVDDSVPMAVCQALIREGAQVRKAPKLPAHTYGLFWRFLVEDDPEVDLYLVRDADSVMNIRERAAVEDWLASGAPYHVMRDYPSHSELILAGMWGAHRGNLEPMGKRILAYVKGSATRLNDRVCDQRFLRDEIWPLIRRDALVHDSWFQFGKTQKFREEFALPWPMHVGQNDWVRFRPTEQAAPAVRSADAPE
ncbi:MAG: tetratricopeptide repeat protein [Alphaproteobacteria bacterium]